MTSNGVRLKLWLVAIGSGLFLQVGNAQSCATWAASVIQQYESGAHLGARLATNRTDGAMLAMLSTSIILSLMFQRTNL